MNNTIKVFASIVNLFLMLAFSVPLRSYAEQNDGTSKQVYDAIVLAESLYKLETSSDQCPTNDRSGFWGLCITKNSINEERLRGVLRSRADAGDTTALFYWGVITSRSGSYWTDSKTEAGIYARKQSYDTAITYYKKACPAISEACWNIADIYAKGLGATKSNLAAAEWFYKAGISYLANERREEALASLEEIEKIDSKNPLASKLKRKLQEGAPK